jgi:hypothetical protein
MSCLAQSAPCHECPLLAWSSKSQSQRSPPSLPPGGRLIRGNLGVPLNYNVAGTSRGKPADRSSTGPACRPAHTAVYAPLGTCHNRTIAILILCRIAQAHHFSIDIIAMPEFQEWPDRVAARSSRETRRAANQLTPRQCGLHSTIWYRGDRHRPRQGPVGRRADQR